MKAFDMTMNDAALVLLLAARLVGTDTAIREAAKRCAKCLPRSDRPLMFSIINSRNPLEVVMTWKRLEALKKTTALEK